MPFMSQLTTGLAVLALFLGCSEPSGVMGEIEPPQSFDRQAYLTKHFEHLESYCELLEHLYSQSDPDAYVVSELERLIFSKILLAQAVSLDAADLDRDSVSALIAVLRFAKSESFGDAFDKPMILSPSIDYLRSIESDLREREEYLRSQVRY
jgi:hypothetical protein